MSLFLFALFLGFFLGIWFAQENHGLPKMQTVVTKLSETVNGMFGTTIYSIPARDYHHHD